MHTNTRLCTRTTHTHTHTHTNAHMHTHVQPALEHLLSLDLSYIETLDMEELATRGGGRGGLLRGLKRLV